MTDDNKERPATAEDIKKVQDQLAQICNDPDMTIVSAPHWTMDKNGELPDAHKEPLTIALEDITTVAIWTFLENLCKFGYDDTAADKLFEWYSKLPDETKYEMSAQVNESIENAGDEEDTTKNDNDN